MAEIWSDRKRQTNKLVGAICRHLFRSPKTVEPEQLHGLSALCWITKNHDNVSNTYIESTKIPALKRIFPNLELPNDILGAEELIISETDVALQTGDISAHSGFTNLRGGYRKSSIQWFRNNHLAIEQLFQNACMMSSDSERVQLAKMISKLPKIAGAGKLDDRPMRPECILSPTLFALDADLRFPIINGNDNLGRVFKEFDIQHGELDQQCRSMLTIIDDCNLRDAAHLDEWSFQELEELKSRKIMVANKNETLATKDQSDNQLPSKDTEDVEALRKDITFTQTRKHNEMTNLFIKELQDIQLLEGSENNCRYDILIPEYVSKRDLMIEVKSSTSIQSVRMAIGQLLSYTFSRGKAPSTDLAICLPEKPSTDICELLDWLNIHLIWLNDHRLMTNSVRLRGLFSFSSEST